jgi:nitrogen fixation protein NifU and related proteins
LDRPFAELDELYREVVLDHYRSPRGREPVASPDVEREGYNPICGDEVKLSLEMDDSRVRQAQVRCRGCAISVASASMMAEILPGLSSEEIGDRIEIFRRILHGEAPPAGLDLGDLEALRGVASFPVRVKCALLPWMTLKEALKERAGSADGRNAPDGPVAAVVVSTEGGDDPAEAPGSPAVEGRNKS